MEENPPLLIWNKTVKCRDIEVFIKYLEVKYRVFFESYWDLHKWTVSNPAFWDEVWNYFNIIASKPYEKVCFRTGLRAQNCQWFIGGLFNYAENLLRIRDDTIALIYTDEEGAYEEVTFAEMYEEVKLYTAAFRRRGLQKGDTVAACMTNRKENVFAMLAVVAIGAVYGGTQPYCDMKETLDYIRTLEPKFLISVDYFSHNGVIYNQLEKLSAIVKGTPSLQEVIIVSNKEDLLSKHISHIPKSCLLQDFLSDGIDPGKNISKLLFEQLAATQPILSIVTSHGTNTKQRTTISAQVLLSQLIDFYFYLNVRKGSKVFNNFKVGCSDWYFCISALALGVTLVLYEDTGTYTRCDRLNFWNLTARYEITHALITATHIECMKKMDTKPSPSSNLEHLTTVAVMGKPLDATHYDYLNKIIKEKLNIINFHDSSDTSRFFAGDDLNLSTYNCGLPIPTLGRTIRCFDFNKNVVSNGISFTNLKKNGVITKEKRDNGILNNAFFILSHGVHFCRQPQETLVISDFPLPCFCIFFMCVFIVWILRLFE